MSRYSVNSTLLNGGVITIRVLSQHLPPNSISSGTSLINKWVSSGDEVLTGTEFPADARILDFGNPTPSDAPWVTTGLARAESLTGTDFPADA